MVSLAVEFLARCALTAFCAFFTLCVWFFLLYMTGGDWFHGVCAMCPDGGLDYPPMNERIFPLKQECNYADGRTVNLTPWFVNPVICLFGGLTLYCLWTVLRTVWKMADHDPYA